VWLLFTSYEDYYSPAINAMIAIKSKRLSDDGQPFFVAQGSRLKAQGKAKANINSQG